jgi:hypothetical protein
MPHDTPTPSAPPAATSAASPTPVAGGRRGAAGGGVTGAGAGGAYIGGGVSASVVSVIAGIPAEDSSLIKASGAWSESVTDSPPKLAERASHGDSTSASASDAAASLLADACRNSADAADGPSSGAAAGAPDAILSLSLSHTHTHT